MLPLSPVKAQALTNKVEEDPFRYFFIFLWTNSDLFLVLSLYKVQAIRGRPIPCIYHCARIRAMKRLSRYRYEGEDTNRLIHVGWQIEISVACSVNQITLQSESRRRSSMFCFVLAFSSSLRARVGMFHVPSKNTNIRARALLFHILFVKGVTYIKHWVTLTF